MKITVLSSKAVRPADGSCGALATTDDAIPLTVFDSVSLNEYVSVIYAFAPSSPTNAELEAGLAKALVEYREWAGRLGQDVDGNPAILLNDAGARFVEAVTEVALESVMPLKPTPEVLSLHPNGKAAEELLLIQVTRFVCGSLVVGLTTQHIVSDGRAASNFFLAWSQATRGAAIKPAPVHDRASFFKPRDPPQIEYEHRGAEFKHSKKVDDYKEKNHPDDEVVVSKVHFNRDLISKLKSVASANAHRPYSTLKCVVAHLWRCMTKARGLGGHEITAVRISVDGRARMNPPVPEGYVGNVVLWALPSTTVRELMTRPLQYAVELIHREVARMNDGYFKSFVDFVSSGAVTKEGLVLMADAAAMVLSPNIEVDSWVRIPFCDLDFGGGPPLVFMPTYLPVEGQVFLVESSSGDGSIDAYVPLFSRSMDAFKSYCYTLEQGEDKKLATHELHQLVSVGTAQH